MKKGVVQQKSYFIATVIYHEQILTDQFESTLLESYK